MANKHWSYSAGEHGKGRIRVFEREPHGDIYLEYYQAGARKRLKLKGRPDRATAVAKAEKLAAGLAEVGALREEPRDDGPLRTARLFTLYLGEVTPTKKDEKQRHDHTTAEMFERYLGADTRVDSLGIVEFNRFIHLRRSGEVRPASVDTPRPVSNSSVRSDLKFMRAVLTWAVDAGRLARHPWQGKAFKIPKVKSPRRPNMRAEYHEALLEHAPNWRCWLALIIGRATRSRNGSVRHLKWSDLDFTRREMRWQADYQKDGKTALTPMPEAVREALMDARVPRGIGDAWVFPAARTPEKPTGRHSFQTWIGRAKSRWLETIGDEQERARLAEAIERLGYHGEKRAGVRDPRFRSLPPAVQAALARTTYETLAQVYDEIDVDVMRQAEAQVGGGMG